MKVLSTVQAFNEPYQAGDRLLLVDPFGQVFVDTLTKPAIALGEEAYVTLEQHRYMVNIRQVVRRVKQVPTPVSSNQQWLIHQLRCQAEGLKKKIDGYQQTIRSIQQLRQTVASLEKEEENRRLLFERYTARIIRYEQFVQRAQTHYEAVLDKLTNQVPDKPQ